MPDSLVSDFFLSYVRTCIERDALLAADVRAEQDLARFVGLCGALTGQEVNHSQLGRDIGVTPQTAARRLGALSATYARARFRPKAIPDGCGYQPLGPSSDRVEPPGQESWSGSRPLTIHSSLPRSESTSGFGQGSHGRSYAVSELHPRVGGAGRRVSLSGSRGSIHRKVCTHLRR
jgi:hypothetical protein